MNFLSFHDNFLSFHRISRDLDLKFSKPPPHREIPGTSQGDATTSSGAAGGFTNGMGKDIPLAEDKNHRLFWVPKGVFFPRRVYLDIGHPTIRKKHFFLFVFIGAIQQLKQKNIETRPGFEVISATGSV